NDVCGAKGNRTPDLLIANETLYQLSYSPLCFSAYARPPSQTKTAADADQRAVALLVTGLIGGDSRPWATPMQGRVMAQGFGNGVLRPGIRRRTVRGPPPGTRYAR